MPSWGPAERSVVRRENLLHAATAVLVRDPDGRIYVHRRSPDKDWAPSHHDAAAGGVMGYGEQPAASAARELAEELGVTGATLRPLGLSVYEDDTHALRGALLRDHLGRPGPARRRRGGLGRLDDAAGAGRACSRTRRGCSCRTPGSCSAGWRGTASATTAP